jgi:uncharacterized protein YecE (DUF72 family)
MRLLAGTSGFSYKEWQGPFYPEKLPAKAMLEHYAGRLPIVEINNTFYRMPNAAALAGWRSQVPDTFRFAIKAPRRITHIRRLRDCSAEIEYLFAALPSIEPCLGSVLFQLPPFFKRDTGVLTEFVAALPAGCKAAFEFRHESWFADDVFAALAARNLALAHSESDTAEHDLPWTADWAYLRLRKTQYSPRDLEAWLAKLRSAKLAEVQVFFKHEDQATGPLLALKLLELAGQA